MQVIRNLNLFTGDEVIYQFMLEKMSNIFLFRVHLVSGNFFCFYFLLSFNYKKSALFSLSLHIFEIRKQIENNMPNL